jgi:iron complex outermembrane recepter protein
MNLDYLRAHAAPRLKLLAGTSLTTLMVFMACPANAQEAAPQSPDDDQAVLDLIVVTGSFIKRKSQSDLPSPTQVIDQEDIASTGLTSVGDLLALQPANIGSVGGVQSLLDGNDYQYNQRSANLRGLGPSSTLVLLNGRRVASTSQDALGNNYVNLSTLVPTNSINRIETVLDGASALYGSDAIAGVINIITDDAFEGVHLSGQYTFIEDSPEAIVQLRLGGGGERFHTTASFSYEYTDSLQNFERDRTNIPITSGSSFPGQFILSSRPVGSGGGDLIIDNGVDGLINYSQVYDDRVAATGSTVQQFADPSCTVPGTGGILVGGPLPEGSCRFSFQEANGIRPRSNIFIGHVKTTYDLGDAHELFVEGRYYYQDASYFFLPSFPQTNGRGVVPASSPFNIFGVDATFVGRPLPFENSVAGLNEETSELQGSHLVAGLTGGIGDRWNYSISGVWSRDYVAETRNDTNGVSFQNALNGFGGPDCIIDALGVPTAGQTPGQAPCFYFSPFGTDAQNNNPDLIFNLRQALVQQTTVSNLIGDAVISGSFADGLLPGGPIGVAFGGQIRGEEREVLYDDFHQSGLALFLGGGRSGSGSRSVKAGFLELSMPLHETLQVDTAVRYESYGEFDTVDPKVAALWRPFDNLSLRGSWSTAFRAPALSQSVGSERVAAQGQTIDPLDPLDTGTFRTINTVSNPNLRPESSTNFNLGATWEPAEGLVLSVDYWNFNFTGQIARENQQQVIDADPTGPQVIRDQFGNLVSVNVSFFNAGATSTDGFDINATYVFDVGAHQFSINNNLSLINSYEVQIGEGQPVFDRVGFRNANNPGTAAPKIRNVFSADWTYNDRHSANVKVRYTGEVVDDLFVPITGTTEDTIESWTTVDAQYALTFGKDDSYSLSVGAVNLFNEAPPSAKLTAYEPRLHDVLGRRVYIRLDTKL